MLDVGLWPVFAIALFIPIAWLIGRLHKAGALATGFRSPRKQASTAVCVVLVVFFAVGVFFFVWWGDISKIVRVTGEASPVAVALQWMVYALFFFAPVLAVVMIKRQSFESVGITRKNLKFSLFGGLAFSALWLAVGFSMSPQSLSRVFTEASFYNLLSYVAVGFGEELLFRGYLQHRCTAWLGEAAGLMFSSVIMAFAHVPQRLVVFGATPVEAFVNSALLLPVSVFLGLLFLKTQNVVGPSLFHTILDFANTL
jgi:membrane protease YdiL (CAAX protease family)